MILSLVPDVIKLPGAAVIGAALMFFPAKWLGQSEGKQMAATAALSKSVQVLRQRNVINDEVSTSDSAALCSDYFVPGSEEHIECLRWLATPQPSAEDGGIDNPDGSSVRKPDCKP